MYCATTGCYDGVALLYIISPTFLECSTLFPLLCKYKYVEPSCVYVYCVVYLPRRFTINPWSLHWILMNIIKWIHFVEICRKTKILVKSILSRFHNKFKSAFRLLIRRLTFIFVTEIINIFTLIIINNIFLIFINYKPRQFGSIFW